MTKRIELSQGKFALDEEIAYELGREVDHIRDKRRRMGYHKREVIKKSG